MFFNPYFSVFKKKIGETEWGLGWIPLGGYVKIAGMVDESMDKEQLAQPPQPWEFRSKPAWQRLIIILGGVIVNFFLEYLNHPRVLKTHFNKFMVDIHNKLHKLKNESNPLPKIVKTFKKDFDIIFFDEFQITNIADAMILGKLLEQFFSNNIFIITTSNAKPDDLYLGGLQRDQFLPYIENIKDNTLVYSLNSGKDYRELYLNKQNRFFIVKDPQTKKNFNQVGKGSFFRESN